MSRPIKFRCWNNCLRKYIPEEELLEAFGECINEDHLYIEQYTGLKDKNGTEIYEGDIISVSDRSNYEVRQFRTGAWRIGRDDLYVWADSSEVIGNIHENPELLGSGK